MQSFSREEVYASIVARFEKQVILHGENPAIFTTQKIITYNELNQLANKVAHAILTTCGDEPIPILLEERDIDHIIAIFGVLKAGKIYTVINSKSPKSYQQEILRDLQAKYILTNSDCGNIHGYKQLFLDKVLSSDVVENPNIRIGGDDIASIVYTSGSTKISKGVQRYHKTILHRIWLYTTIQKVTYHDRQSHLFSCQFVASEADVYGALLNGARLYKYSLLDKGLLQIIPWLIDNKITLFHPPVPIFRRLLYTLKQKVPALDLRLVALAGEALYKSDAQLFWRYFPQSCRLCHRFSSTETSNIAQFTFDNTDVFQEEIVPVGSAVFDKEISLMDGKQRIISQNQIGESGEIVVRSHFLAKGYWRKESFPFTEDGRAIYSTGDLACYNAQGLLVHLGRKDYQLKIRGYRVNTQQIEAVFLDNSAVREVAVIACDVGKQKDKQLRAYVVFTANSSCTLKQLNLWLKERLPEYMIPAHIVSLVSLPLTVNGKINRKLLLSQNIPTEKKHASRSLSSIEKQIYAIWQEVLQVKSICFEDDFFALGGHSLTAITLVSKVRELLQIDIALPLIFEAPTLEKFAEKIKQIQQKRAPIIAQNKKKYLASSIQRQMWFLQQLHPQNYFYNMSRLWQLDGELNEEQLRLAIKKVVERHPILRVTLKQYENGDVFQVIHSQEIFLSIMEISDEQQLLFEIQKTTKTPFCLTKFPLFRLKIFRLSPTKNILCIVMHHAISDHWSMRILWNDLVRFYNHCKTKKPLQIPKLAAHYGDFCAWQQNTEKSEKYWRQKCSDLQVLEIPTDKVRPKHQTFRGNTYTTYLKSEIEDGLRIIAKRHNCTLFMTLLAAFNILLHRYSGQKDIVVGSPIANRHYGGTQNMVGFFVNNLVLRNNLEGNPSFVEFLHDVKVVTLEAYAHQDYPFEKLVERLNPIRDTSRNPIFQILINMLDIENTHNMEHFHDIKDSRYSIETSTTRFDITLYIEQRKDMRLTWRYSTDLFIEETIERISQHFVLLLQSIVANPGQKIHELSMLPFCKEHSQTIHKKLLYALCEFKIQNL